MGKKRKRPARIDAANAASLFHLTGVSGEASSSSSSSAQIGNSIDGCLAELDNDFQETTTTTAASVSPAATAASQVGTVMEKGILPNQLWDFSLNVHQEEAILRAKPWMDLFQNWERSGRYTTGLLPSFDTELARHFQMEKLSSFLLKESREIRMPLLERWLLDAKLEEEEEESFRGRTTTTTKSQLLSDPVIPNGVDESWDCSCRLVVELTDKGIPDEKAQEIVQDLCHKTMVALQDLTALKRRTHNKCPLGKGDRILVEDNDSSDRHKRKTLIYNRKSWKKPYRIHINESHYNKLRAMFENVHNVQLSSKSHSNNKLLHSFHLIVMCLLLRYSSLSGGQLLHDLRGGGMQGAIQPEVFRALHQSLGTPCMECFASPLNAHYSRFGSAFGNDLDWHFGSVGNFFSLDLGQGCFEVNPPFAPGLMLRMAEHIASKIQKANGCKAALTFVVVVPTGDNKDDDGAVVKQFASESFRKLKELSCGRHTRLQSRSHGYVEGSQHLRPTSYKQSMYDTSVLLIQSKRAAKRFKSADRFDAVIREAFACRTTGENFPK